MLPRFTLRIKLVLVAILLLAIPLSGLWYAAKMRTFLYSAQEQAVSMTAKAVSTILNNRPELFERNILESLNTKSEIHLFNLEHRINLDGEFGDWGEIINKAEVYDHNNALNYNSYVIDHLNFRHISGKFENHIYALFIVYDSSVIHREENSLHLERSDHLQIALENREGKLDLYKISPEAAGWVTAYLMPDDPKNFVPVRNEPRIQGVWKDTSFGYVIEIRIPLNLVRNKLSFALADVNDPDSRKIEALIGTGGVNKLEDLGALLVRSPNLEKIISALERPATKIWVVDKLKRVRVIVGDLYSKDVPKHGEIPPGSQETDLLGPLYRLFAKQISQPIQDESTYLSELDLNDITGALAGESVSLRRPIPGGDSEIITAIEPLRTGDDILGAIVVEQTTDSILAVENNITEDTIFITILVFSIGTIVLFIFASRLSSRVRRLSNQADKALSKDGRINTSFTPSQESDEIGDLSRNLAVMMRRLQGYHSYQEKMADNLEHELRTPMAGISASLTNLKARLESESDLGSYLLEAQDNLKRIEDILAKIRDATMLEDALRQDEKEIFNLGDALNAWVTQGYSRTFPARKFSLEKSSKAIFINADPNRIYQMLDKIIENAVSFSPEGSCISLGLHVEKKDLMAMKNNAVLQIANEGPCLAPETVEQMFHSMYSNRQGHPKGLHMGLGLFIVRTVTEFHGGTVSAKNRTDGVEGVVFTISIPSWDG